LKSSVQRRATSAIKYSGRAATAGQPVEITYLVLDARYEKIRDDGAIRSGALLTAIGIDTEGKRSVLGCSVQLAEAEPHWRKFLESSSRRGMHGVKLVVSDDHAGLRAARQAVMGRVRLVSKRDRRHSKDRTANNTSACV
jgi:putative transposase